MIGIKVDLPNFQLVNTFWIDRIQTRKVNKKQTKTKNADFNRTTQNMRKLSGQTPLNQRRTDT